MTAIVLGKDEWHACKKAIQLWPGGDELGDWFYVSEAGYRFAPYPAPTDEYFPACIHVNQFLTMIDELDYD